MVGAHAGESIQNSRFNTFIGTDAGRRLTGGVHNTFVGEQAGDRQITGDENSILGAHTGAGGGSGVGNRNTMLGAFTGALITNGDENTFTGRGSGNACTDGSFNTFTGARSGAFCNTGISNTLNGYQSGQFTSTGNENVFMGFRSGFFNSTGSNNTYIGTNTGFPVFGLGLVGNTATNSSAIGNGAQIRRSNVMILGNNLVNVGIGLSNDITTAQGPQNKLEIDAGVNGLNPSPSGAAGTSGLRFRDLHSGNTTIPNPGTGVLSVDVNGDVILVAALAGPAGPAGTSGGIVNAQNGISLLNPSTVELGRALGSGGALANLLSSREIPLNNNNIVFSVPGSAPSPGANHIGIGTANPSAQLHIKSFSNAGTTTQFQVDDSNDNISFAVKDHQRVGIGTNNPTSSLEIKTKLGSAIAPGITLNSESNFPSNFIVFQKQNSAKWNIGHYDGANSILRFNKGNETAPNSNTFMYLDDNLNSVNILKPTYINGTPNTSGNILEVQGQSLLNGNITGTGFDSHASDILFKTHIDSISNALSIINQLKPKQYYFDTTNVYGLFFDAKKQYGLIAQDVETILPELVGNATKSAELDTAGNVVKPSISFKTLNYNAFFGIMIKAIQEQQTKIDSLTKKLNSKDSIQDARLAALEAAITQCCSNNNAKTSNNSISTTNNSLNVELSDKDAIVLNQNVPNPFAEQTTITYNVPTSVAKAQIIFYNGAGQIIQTVDITTRGKGKVNVFANDLSSGLYHYTLVADGKVVDSKKMVRE